MKHTPKIGLCLSGGGSRAIAFHLGCLKALNEHGILSKVSLISTVSGGSVIGAMYAYSDDSFAEFTARVIQQLESGFQKKIIFKFVSKLLRSRMEALVAAFDERLYHQKKLAAETRDGIEIIINACELSTNTAFRFGNKVISSWVWGKAPVDSVLVAEAVAASAAYPVFLPTMNKVFEFEKDGETQEKKVFLIDGGVYENLGVTPLLPGRAAEHSYPYYEFDYIIACDAEHSRPFPRKFITHFFAKISACFSSLMRRVRSMNFKVLHEYERTGEIKGFVLSCLSCEDEKIFAADDNFVPYAKVADYPTDFGKMKKEDIELLSSRGEQITDKLIKRYLNPVP